MSKSKSTTPILDSFKDVSSRPVKTNLLLQNCFLKDCTAHSSTTSKTPKTFVTLDEVVEQDGVKIKEKIVDYHITPQYVNSFVDSADYRKDPLSAIANGNFGNNLGDITEVQNVGSMSLDKAKDLYEQLKAKFASAPLKDTSSSESDVSADAPKSVDGSKSNKSVDGSKSNKEV